MTEAPLILAFGDSLTAGYGLRTHEAFPARLEALLRARRPGARVVNAGVSGETSAGGLARLPRVLSRLERRPDLAIVELGANDFLRALPPARLQVNLVAIVAELKRCGIPVLLAGMQAPPFLGQAAMAFNAVYPAVAAAEQVALDPFFLIGVAGLPHLTLADRLHPNARAIELVAARVAPLVERLLDEGRAAA